MSSIIELRKTELTSQINEQIKKVQFFIDNKRRNENATSISEYLEYNTDKISSVKRNLELIKNRFNPQSESFVTFENCINELNELLNEITKIQERGESKQENLQYLGLVKFLTPTIIIVVLSIILINLFGAYWAWMKETGWGFLTLIFIGYILALPLGFITSIITGEVRFDFVTKFFRKLFLED